ncbi:iron-sulfur cluster assembly protein, putative [Perkinsus marinus ATCC 50983]|uniref:Iron-sulfur cluster assembly protein, putative n=1 Tax=Perkinsus marinus (strain ATCC 50983 / TXsc) TaxID=423536 RepID=C5KDP6_PERM5|nr:iron-sulfur cluster assembly protein, putative [Perkinsus marinus ATCC 50983]XP_002785553.1 iron-sulfur cluster assembly protein, putative [Perkinsus marinus ATCC 50983]EER01503.1 iron-sulfur cluster assembly protein, putative [Perkinsus marinus ATCC 50983]EER17349.1 iron-sulfur cluster assembly protein, putative [Perkinsus marinus ATCC 50983]|eukprot:XP_002768785.1 iron-sulfur cluster assembly protein, putative [Perkinsus marinus ATCC 50983]
MLRPIFPSGAASRITSAWCSCAAQKRYYHDNVLDHFKNPRNAGKLDKKDPSVGTAVVGKASCGDVVQLQVKIEDGVVQDAKFKTFGCGSAIASSSLATEMIKGKTQKEASELKNTDISGYLKLPPVKIHCSLLVEEAVHAALADYERKRSSLKGAEEATVV